MILVDADACPVKDEIYTVAFRHKCPVRLFAGQYLRHPDHPLITMTMAGDAFDAADDLIAEQAGPGTLVITADLPLADRAIKAGAQVMTHQGRGADFGQYRRQAGHPRPLGRSARGLEGQTLGGPRPFSKTDRSAFLQALDRALRTLGA
jgi:uncharacterized protein